VSDRGFTDRRTDVPRLSWPDPCGGHGCGRSLSTVRIRPPSRKNIEAFRDWAHERTETVGIFVVSGGEDFLIHLAVPNTDALYAFVIDRLTERPEVADVRTSIVYEHLQRFTVDQLPSSASPAVGFRNVPSTSQPGQTTGGRDADHEK
jgi:hypothetical protein